MTWQQDLLLGKAIGAMFASIGKAVATCPQASNGKHRFAGYPREAQRCRWCGTRRHR